MLSFHTLLSGYLMAFAQPLDHNIYSDAQIVNLTNFPKKVYGICVQLTNPFKLGVWKVLAEEFFGKKSQFRVDCFCSKSPKPCYFAQLYLRYYICATILKERPKSYTT